MPNYQEIIDRFQQQQEATRLANEQRYAEALELYDQIISQYEPGGGFGAGYEAQLERTKTKTIAGQEQKLVSSGLYGTSITAGLGQKFEEEVGQPARLKLEDIRMGRYAEAVGQKAGLIERREDVGPDYSLIAQLSSKVAQRPTTTVSYGGAAFPSSDDWTSGIQQRTTIPRPVSKPYVPRAERPGYKAPTPIQFAESTYGSLGRRISYA